MLKSAVGVCDSNKFFYISIFQQNMTNCRPSRVLDYIPSKLINILQFKYLIENNQFSII